MIVFTDDRMNKSLLFNVIFEYSRKAVFEELFQGTVQRLSCDRVI